MAQPGQDDSPRVLHVGPQTSELAALYSQQIADCGFTEDSCPDIYRALARIGRADPPPWSAALVDAGRLDGSELEFFRITARHHAGLPVYVYAAPGVAGRAESAILCGAQATLPPDEFRRILKPDSEPQPSAPADQRIPAPLNSGPEPRPSGRADQQSPAARSNDPEPQTSASPDDDTKAASEPEDNTTSAARVPWLRYADTPKRTGPTPPPKQQQPASQEETDAPLLSPEELEALIGDQEPAPNADHGKSEK